MRDGSADRTERDSTAAAGNGRNGRTARKVRLVDRSHLLKRPARSTARDIREGSAIRLRRERRVSGAFSGIPALSRTEEI